MKSIIYPKKLQKGKIVGTTATSSGLMKKQAFLRLNNAPLNFKKLGYSFLETDNTRKIEKLVSSDGKTRAKEFMDLWKNEDVTWMIATRGGEFLIEMLEYLDKAIIKSHTPKWVQGFSDTSLLLYYLTTNFNIATSHGENVGDFGMKELESALLKNIEILEQANISEQNSFPFYEKTDLTGEEGKELASYNLTEKSENKHLYDLPKDKVSGRILGGCMDVLVQLIGTKFDNTVEFCNQFEEGMLFYLENCELKVPALYRTLLQMKHAGWFEHANGILLGRTASFEAVEGFTYEDALHAVFDEFQIPVIYDLDFGHVAPQWTMINGAFRRI